MLHLEEWMNLKDLRNHGLTISEIARRTGHDRKTVRKYLNGDRLPQAQPRKQRPSKLDPFKEYLLTRMGQGVFNCVKLLDEIQSQGYPGQISILKDFVRPYRRHQQELAVMRFETRPGQQAQVDWAHFGQILVEGRWHKLYGFMMTLGYSRMRYLEFMICQDLEHFLQGHLNAFGYFGGVPEEVLVDNLKSAVLGRQGAQIHWHPRYLDFASYYGFVPKACWPYRPQTKGKVENTVGYVKGHFWPGIGFVDLEDLNRQARGWCDTVANAKVHATTREVPWERLPEEGLRPLPVRDYDTSYLAHRQVQRDCLVHYRGSRYSVPHRFAGQPVVVREPLGRERLRIYRCEELIAEHPLSRRSGALVCDPRHFEGLPTRRRLPEFELGTPTGLPLPSGPGIGVERRAPAVEKRSLAFYEQLVGDR
jgi:transposase